MLNYLESIMNESKSDDTKTNESNASESTPNVTPTNESQSTESTVSESTTESTAESIKQSAGAASSDKQSLTFIITIYGTITEPKLIPYLDKRRIAYFNTHSALDGLVTEMYNDMENRFYTAEEIMDLVTDKVINFIEMKMKTINVFLFPLYRKLYDINRVIDKFSKSCNLKAYFLNVNAVGLFDSLYSTNIKTQAFSNPQSLLARLVTFYEKVSTQTDDCLVFTRSGLKEYLMMRRCYFANEQDVDEIVKKFFEILSEPSDIVYIKFKSIPGVKNINMPIYTNLDTYFNQIEIN